MARKAEVYADTSAFVAFLDRSDTHHPLFRRLFAELPRAVTTSLVVAEGHAWFLRRYDRTRAMHFLALIEDMAPLAVLPVGPAEIAGADGRAAGSGHAVTTGRVSAALFLGISSARRKVDQTLKRK